MIVWWNEQHPLHTYLTTHDGCEVRVLMKPRGLLNQSLKWQADKPRPLPLFLTCSVLQCHSHFTEKIDLSPCICWVSRYRHVHFWSICTFAFFCTFWSVRVLIHTFMFIPEIFNYPTNLVLFYSSSSHFMAWVKVRKYYILMYFSNKGKKWHEFMKCIRVKRMLYNDYFYIRLGLCN